MITITDEQLHQVFQREYPNDLDYVGSGRDELLLGYPVNCEVEMFVHKRWEDVDSGLLQDCFDAPCFLNPRAFQYFFPAFIKQSQVDVEKTGLLVDSLINMLADKRVHGPELMKAGGAQFLREYPELVAAIESIDGKEISEWCQERWKLFTRRQWDLIQKWLNWIDQSEKWEVNRDDLRQALKNAAKWQAQLPEACGGEYNGSSSGQ